MGGGLSFGSLRFSWTRYGAELPPGQNRLLSSMGLFATGVVYTASAFQSGSYTAGRGDKCCCVFRADLSCNGNVLPVEDVSMKRKCLFVLFTMIVISLLSHRRLGTLQIQPNGADVRRSTSHFLEPGGHCSGDSAGAARGLRGPKYGRRGYFCFQPLDCGLFLGSIFQWAASWPVAAISFSFLRSGSCKCAIILPQ